MGEGEREGEGLWVEEVYFICWTGFTRDSLIPKGSGEVLVFSQHNRVSRASGG